MHESKCSRERAFWLQTMYKKEKNDKKKFFENLIYYFVLALPQSYIGNVISAHIKKRNYESKKDERLEIHSIKK